MKGIEWNLMTFQYIQCIITYVVAKNNIHCINIMFFQTFEMKFVKNKNFLSIHMQNLKNLLMHNFQMYKYNFFFLLVNLTHFSKWLLTWQFSKRNCFLFTPIGGLKCCFWELLVSETVDLWSLSCDNFWHNRVLYVIWRPLRPLGRFGES